MRHKSRSRARVSGSSIGLRGFTLIELLVAVAILGIIVAAVARLFQHSGVAWETGTRNAEMSIKGRAALAFMEREMEQAVQGGGLGNVAIMGGGSDVTLAFPMFPSLHSGRRLVQWVGYTYDGNNEELSRKVWYQPVGGDYPPSMLAYTNAGAAHASQVMVDGVKDFLFRPVGSTLDGDPLEGVELCLVLRSRYGADDGRDDKTFQTRVYFHNRLRYEY